jgi:hypothetical protein
MTPADAPQGTTGPVGDEPGDDLLDEDTVISARKRPAEDLLDEATAISARRQPPAEADEDTVVSRRTPPAGVDTVPEEDTVLRPRASASRQASAPASEHGVRTRDAHVPDAAILRAPAKPRGVPPVTAVRETAPPRPTAPGAPAPVPDHESVERAARARARRRVLIVVLCAAAGAIAATTALLLLLT